MPTKLYHVTAAVSVLNIYVRGVDPRYSQGKQALSWWVDQKRILYGLAHASARHEIPVNLLVIVSAWVDLEEIRPTRWAGVYTAAKPITVAGQENASDWLNQRENCDAE